MAYHKVLFTSTAHGSTAGLIVNTDQHDVRDMSAISRLYPAYEAPKMRQYHVSPAYATFEDAFGHVFSVDVFGNPK